MDLLEILIKASQLGLRKEEVLELYEREVKRKRDEAREKEERAILSWKLEKERIQEKIGLAEAQKRFASSKGHSTPRDEENVHVPSSGGKIAVEIESSRRAFIERGLNEAKELDAALGVEVGLTSCGAKDDALPRADGDKGKAEIRQMYEGQNAIPAHGGIFSLGKIRQAFTIGHQETETAVQAIRSDLHCASFIVHPDETFDIDEKKAVVVGQKVKEKGHSNSKDGPSIGRTDASYECPVSSISEFPEKEDNGPSVTLILSKVGRQLKVCNHVETLLVKNSNKDGLKNRGRLGRTQSKGKRTRKSCTRRKRPHNSVKSKQEGRLSTRRVLDSAQVERCIREKLENFDMKKEKCNAKGKRGRGVENRSDGVCILNLFVRIKIRKCQRMWKRKRKKK